LTLTFVQLIQSTLHELALKKNTPSAVDRQVAWW